MMGSCVGRYVEGVCQPSQLEEMVVTNPRQLNPTGVHAIMIGPYLRIPMFADNVVALSYKTLCSSSKLSFKLYSKPNCTSAISHTSQHQDIQQLGVQGVQQTTGFTQLLQSQLIPPSRYYQSIVHAKPKKIVQSLTTAADKPPTTSRSWGCQHQ